MSILTPPAEAATAQSLQWLALALTPGLGATRARRLVEHFGSVEAVFRASLTELEATGLLAVSAQALGTGKSLELAQEEMAKTTAAGVRVVSLDDAAYPSRLREIYDPPLILYVRGSAEVLSQPGIAVVGTRHPTPYGSGMAERLAIDLSARSLVIISGMARGVDTAAHRGTISAKGKTVAVFGTGVDVLYPKENSRLADQILSLGGALISEFPLGTFAAPQNFPIRNRIISGMSMGVLVVEAAEYSGTRITARCALEQNRDVFAVPGNVTNKNSWGPNTLIKQGAKLVATWEDIWEEMPENVRLMLTPAVSDESQKAQTASLFPDGDNPLSPHERKIYALLKADEATHIDEIVERLEAEMSSSEIFAALFELELAGKVRQLAGEEFCEELLASSFEPRATSEQTTRMWRKGSLAVKDFKELKVWSKAHEATLSVYRATQQFPKEELFGLTSQIRRAASSMGANLAEGCGRRSDGEMARFLGIARGSAVELEYHLLLARDLNLLSPAGFSTLERQVDEIQRMLTTLIERVRPVIRDAQNRRGRESVASS